MSKSPIDIYMEKCCAFQKAREALEKAKVSLRIRDNVKCEVMEDGKFQIHEGDLHKSNTIYFTQDELISFVEWVSKLLKLNQRKKNV